MKARIVIDYGNEKKADAITGALIPDDRSAPPHLKIRTWSEKGRLNSEVECKGKFETFMATVDDILSSIQAGEKTIEMIERSDNYEGRS